LDFFFKHGVGYATETVNRPQTLYGIADSPIGLAAWILDHDASSYALIARVFDGKPEGLTRDDILDNITLYWLTKTTVSSARLYWESKLAFFDVRNVPIPVAVSVFPDEIHAAPRSWAERAFPKLIHYNKLEKGGHFAQWEQPALFTAEVRAGRKSITTFGPGALRVQFGDKAKFQSIPVGWGLVPGGRAAGATVGKGDCFSAFPRPIFILWPEHQRPRRCAFGSMVGRRQPSR